MKTYQLAMQGMGHIKSGTPCQDKIATLSMDDVTCIALADGAGSAALSHFGAETATQETTKILCENFDDFYASKDTTDTISYIIENVLAKLEREATLHGCELSDLACTLLFVACKKGKYIAGQLGDGCMAYARQGKCKLATKPEKGEFANSTFFITSPGAEKHLKLFKGELDNISGFMLMSDGAAESLYQRQYDYVAPLVYRLINDTFCKTQTWLKESFNPFFEKNILTRTNDDCSLVILNTCDSYRSFFDSIDDCDIAKLFYKSRSNKNYVNQYVEILLNVHKTSDMSILAKMTNISISTIKRRLQNLRRLGFCDVIKFFN